jgi:hypothetical protein
MSYKDRADVTCYIYYGASYTEKCYSYIYVITDFFVAISKAYDIKESEVK